MIQMDTPDGWTARRGDERGEIVVSEDGGARVGHVTNVDDASWTDARFQVTFGRGDRDPRITQRFMHSSDARLFLEGVVKGANGE